MREEKQHEDVKTLVVIDDGFGDGEGNDRLIQGTILRCVDGKWSAKDGTDFPPGTKLIALGTACALQHWKDGLPVETIVRQKGKPLPDLDELNEKIPQKKWEKYNGEPRPPWCRQHIAYLIDPGDASIYTFINSTVGAAIAVSKLKDRVQWMRKLRGAAVVPLVKLDAKTMKTKHGQKLRPEFTVVEWRDFSGPTNALPDLSGNPIEPPSLKEELNDSVDNI
jgi:hypothetical protein